MLKNYFNIAFRNIMRRKTYAAINIIGLAVGMACCAMILLWVQDEMIVDQFHANKDSIYRIVCDGQGGAFFGSPAPLAPTIKAEIPEIISACRFKNLPRFVFGYNEKSFYEANGIGIDPVFFNMFSFPFVQGDLESAFTTYDNIVITESMAHKYFGNDNPMGKQINIEGEGYLTVSGVIKDIPANSHLQFDYALPYTFYENVQLAGLKWGDFNFKTYIQVQQPVNITELDAKITQIAYDHECPQIKWGGRTFFAQSLKEMYLHPIGAYDIPLGNIKYINIFLIIAVVILSIACFNFINLSTARSLARAKEVGIRKVIGARRDQLMVQFWGEFLLLAVFALAAAIVLVRVSLPWFNNLTGKALTINLADPSFALLLLGITLFCGILAGFYPAVALSRFLPVRVINNQFISGVKGNYLRRLLIIIQFSMSIILIVSTIVVAQQMQFIRAKSWSVKNDIVLHIPIKENISAKYNVVKNELLQHPNIVSVSAKDALPTHINNNTTGIWWQGKTDSQDNIHMETIYTDPDYFTTMDLDILQGRNFAKDRRADMGAAYVLNQEAVKQAGLEYPVGKSFAVYGKQGTIIGIVQDSFFQTFKQDNHPQVYCLFTDMSSQGYFGSLFIRIQNTGDHKIFTQTLAHVESVWYQVNTIAPFEYHFLNETIDAQYQEEQRLMTLFTTFASLAVIISCLGLFGLATFIASSRTKEIGIRKVIGSNVSSLVLMLSNQFIGWVIFANIIAWPIAGYIMHQWLQNYIYRIELSPWPFVIAGLTTLVVSIATISWQTIRAATANPVKALKYE